MCGIAGVVRFDGRGVDERGLAESLSRALAHRGPDGHGVYRSASGRALLVHRRLAIIDPSERGAQPMASADGRYHLTFNGEIYNFRELRKELQADGVRFRTETDTEVVLYLLALDGPAALARLRGMFALGLWDEHEGSLLLARDRYGMKPLYFNDRGDRVAFASEIGALRRAGLIRSNVSPAGVLAYFAWASIPSPLTWVDGVEQLEPGGWRLWNRDGKTAAGSFANITSVYTGAGDVDEATLRERVRAALEDSVRAHFVADVPVGVFLSGGDRLRGDRLAGARDERRGSAGVHRRGERVPLLPRVGRLGPGRTRRPPRGRGDRSRRTASLRGRGGPAERPRDRPDQRRRLTRPDSRTGWPRAELGTARRGPTRGAPLSAAGLSKSKIGFTLRDFGRPRPVRRAHPRRKKVSRLIDS